MSGVTSTSRTTVKLILFILVLAFLVRLAWVLFTPALPTSDFKWYERVAAGLASDHGYSSGETPTAYRPPGYPLLLATIYRFFGRSLTAAQFANVLLGTLTVYLTYMLARRVFSENIALVASVMVALFPSLILYCGLTASENLVTPLLLLALAAYLCALQAQKAAYLVFSGIALGLATLTRPMMLLLPVALWIYSALKLRDLKRVTVCTGLLSGAMVLCILPWTLRNYAVFHRFVPVSTNSGFNLLISFSKHSVGEHVSGQTAGIVELGARLGWGEVQMDRAAQKEAIALIRDNPARAVVLAPMKVFHLFRDDVSGVVWNFTESARPSPRWLRWLLLLWAQGYYVLILCLALTTIVFRKSLKAYRWYGLFLTPVLYWIAFHLVFFGDDRYHLPILPLISIFGAFGALSIVEQLRVKRHEGTL
jgi:4-amino-4-deoxy-L-arabinose transferase-like glycosyltransferase